MNSIIPLFGFLIGAMVAATGIGGGVLLMPALIVVLRVSPVVAVGTALLFMSLTKGCAILLHWKQKTVDFRLAGYLLVGSIPGAVAGVSSLALLHERMGQGFNILLQKAIGVTLVLIALFAFATERLKSRHRFDSNPGSTVISDERRNAIWIGFLGGFLVSTTSLGSGSVLILLMLMFCARSPVVLVGTDIFHAAILTTVATLLNLRINPIDPHLAGLLLVGSIPGAVVGACVASRLDHLWLRRTLLVLAASSGLLML